MNSPYGSIWRKWDFHVHTPYSILNNKFGCNAEEPKDFDKYVQVLFSKALEKDVYAIGITDYFSIDGYKCLKNNYLDNDEKLAELFPDEDMRHRIKEIFVFPNIELRHDTFIEGTNSGRKNIDIHVLFSNEIDPTTIEQSFLHQLTVKVSPGVQPLTHEGIEKIGKTVREDNGGKGDDYSLGLKHVSISYEEVHKLLESCDDFKDSYAVATAVDENLAEVPWNGRDYLRRKSIYYQSNFYLTSNEATRKWALAEGEEEDRIKEFGSIKPCIWGSDAHSFDRMFEPSERRYCWIKADTSFEGLLQVLCEPKDRVYIGKNCPSALDPHRIIESITLNGEDYKGRKVVFNEGLTCIIGGRSTGKSLLIRQLAHAINPTYAAEQEKHSSLEPLRMLADSTVTWKDGLSGEARQIIYLPQTYLNRTVDNPELNEGASKLIGDVLLQNEKVEASYKTLNSKLAAINNTVNVEINKYFDTKEKIGCLVQERLKEGTSAQFKKTVHDLEEQVKQLMDTSSVTPEELEEYAGLLTEIEKKRGEVKRLSNDINGLNALPTPTLSIDESLIDDSNLTQLTPSVADQIQQVVDKINSAVQPMWKQELAQINTDINVKLQETIKEGKALKARIETLRPKVEQNELLKKTADRLAKERECLKAAQEREKRIEELQKEQEESCKVILSAHDLRGQAYISYCDVVKGDTSGLSEELEFSAEPIWKFNDFIERLRALINFRSLAGFRKETKFDLQNLDEDEFNNVRKELLMQIWDAVVNPVSSKEIKLRQGINSRDLVNVLSDDWYNIHYVVKNEGDDLKQMSPGKKGLVLLELIVELEKGTCPILIDQPEDDLDNQSIYTNLRSFIKEAKCRRQIIIVTHNANIALGADAEELIIANQDGAGNKNRSAKFEYRSGSIENNVQDKEQSEYYLDQCSIQEHACRILEGGREALERRRKKYQLS
jgi:ABC-type cobalamin/Fe3+-siderophores transport system ATPase subunit